jgi:hypothetical protein
MALLRISERDDTYLPTRSDAALLTWTRGLSACCCVQDMEMDKLYGCEACDFAAAGCPECQDSPMFERPKAVRWRPEGARMQTTVPSAPTFYPTPEEFQDPVAYIDKIRPEGEK